MNYRNRAKVGLLLLFAAIMMIASVQCTKEGANASSAAATRALLKDDPDSSIYSPFYDSTVVPKSDAVPSRNDYAVTAGVFSIIKTYCASAACHGGGVSPVFKDYASIKAMVVPGNPEGSKLFQMITTNDFNKAMPPVNYGIDLSVTEKVKIYNWIRNGAKELPDLADYRPAAVHLISNGCGSGNCHNEATVGGEWARAKLITVSPTDTFTFTYRNPNTGAVTLYTQLKEPKLSEVWNLYRDSVKKFYADTLANASFRPYKTFSTPVVTASRRGPLNNYNDILLDVFYPKSVRSNGSPVYTNPVTGQNFYVKSDPYNATSSLLSRVDSTLLLANPRTNVYATSHQGGMAYDDGGLKPAEIAIIKAWYFLDPNIPDTWKYGFTGTGIFKYRSSGKIILK